MLLEKGQFTLKVVQKYWATGGTGTYFSLEFRISENSNAHCAAVFGPRQQNKKCTQKICVSISGCLYISTLKFERLYQCFNPWLLLRPQELCPLPHVHLQFGNGYYQTNIGRKNKDYGLTLTVI